MKLYKLINACQPNVGISTQSKCVSWRQTGGCDPNGNREPVFDKSCTEGVSDGASGYCECQGGERRMEKGCNKGPYETCNDACQGAKCGSGKAYHSGSMFKDYSTPSLSNANQCLDKCNSDNACKFWDYGDGWCRLRSNSGDGEQLANGYSFGSKNCKFESSSEMSKSLNFSKSNFILYNI